ncbi:MAG: hypothetical protein IPP73_05130 [Chitinophagaceae bacterium]|nr:hypothetical protein [Chitinophagaceae bacterium]
MKFTVAFILTALLAFISGLYFWWGMAITSALVAVAIPQKPWKAFLAVFSDYLSSGPGLAFWIDMKNNHILSVKIASILPLGGSHIAIILVTGFIGGLVAGLAALTGSFARSSS